MTYQRPVLSRYLDPVELIWLATARRLGITLRRDPTIFSRTDGSGTLWLGPRVDLDEDDTLAQMLLHEVCHWITNGVQSFTLQDWGFALDDADDPREFASLRLQASLLDEHGLRGMFGPTGKYREYFDRLPADPLQPLDGSEGEAEIVRMAAVAIAAAQGPPFAPHLQQALADTASVKGLLVAYLGDYATEVEDDSLPSLWGL